MPRVLVVYDGPAQRRLATHQGIRLTRRGHDVDLTNAPVSDAIRIGYAHVVAAASPELAAVAAGPAIARIGELRIVGAPEPAPATPARQPWAIAALAVIAIATAVTTRALAAPVVYQIVLTIVLTAAALQVIHRFLGHRRAGDGGALGDDVGAARHRAHPA